MRVAIAFALLSLALLVAAAWDWTSGPRQRPDSTSERSGWRGALVLSAVSLLLVGTVWVAAAETGWPRDRALWVGVGAFLAPMTLTRPWWFWDSWKARWLRGAIGDEATAAVYLALAAVMVWAGLYTNWTFGRR